ncbi:MAG: hypothetical protein IPK80_13835 [Nannocystis sp.]|jgi:hypothetical protein|nr:hypothetical protein [Nannocystis sp.]
MSAELVASGAFASALALRWWQRRRDEASRERELAALTDDPPAALDHLSPALARLAQQTRICRLMLEGPLRGYQEPLLSESPWARRRRCDELDLALLNARRALWEWLASFRSLSRGDLEVLGALGLSLRPFRGLLFKTGIFDRCDDPWEERLYPKAPDFRRIFAELHRAMIELRRFERALLGQRADPYRA